MCLYKHKNKLNVHFLKFAWPDNWLTLLFAFCNGCTSSPSYLFFFTANCCTIRPPSLSSWIDNTYLPKIYQQHPFIITMKWSRSWSGLRQPPYPRLCWNLVQIELNYYFNGSSVEKFMMKEFGDPRDRWSKGILRASIVPSRKFWGSAIKKYLHLRWSCLGL